VKTPLYYHTSAVGEPVGCNKPAEEKNRRVAAKKGGKEKCEN